MDGGRSAICGALPGSQKVQVPGLQGNLSISSSARSIGKRRVGHAMNTFDFKLRRLLLIRFCYIVLLLMGISSFCGCSRSTGKAKDTLRITFKGYIPENRQDESWRPRRVGESESDGNGSNKGEASCCAYCFQRGGPSVFRRPHSCSFRNPSASACAAPPRPNQDCLACLWLCSGTTAFA